MGRSSNNALYRDIGMRVKLRRVYLELSPQDVAVRVKIDVDFLEKIEAGLLRAPSFFLIRYAKLAGVSVPWFFDANITGGGPGQPFDTDRKGTNVVSLKKAACPHKQKTKIKHAA